MTHSKKFTIFQVKCIILQFQMHFKIKNEMFSPRNKRKNKSFSDQTEKVIMNEVIHQNFLL